MDQQTDIDFFISRAGADKDIAIHVRQILQEAGYNTLLQSEDFGPSDFMRKMEEGFESDARVISILSKKYQKSKHCRSEYNHILSNDPANLNKRLIVLRIEDCQPVGSLQTLTYTDLLSVLQDFPRFKEAVLNAVGHNTAAMPSWFDTLQRVPQQIIHPDIRPIPNFKGRQQELQVLQTALWSDELIAVITQPTAVHGLGGVGKSILAKEYAWRNKERYTGVWWLNAQTESGIVDGLIELGNNFITGLGDVQDRNAAANETLDYLATHYKDAEKPWLLVYDNIESESIYRKFAPKGGVQTLLTSRENAFSKGIQAIPVNNWPMHEAVLYLRDESRRELTDSQAEKLAEALGCMPLALSHTAAFLRENKGRTPESYLENLDNKWLNQVPEHADYPASVFATYQESIEICEQKAKGAKAVISLAALLSPDNIPFEIYNQKRDLYPEDLQSVVRDEESLTEVLSVLDRLSLIRLDMDTKSFSLHRLVQSSARDVLADRKQGYIISAIEALVAAYPGDNFKDWPAFERLLPHGRQIVDPDHAPDAIDAPLPDLLQQIADYLQEHASYEEAEPLYRRALKIWEAGLGPDHPDLVHPLTGLANLLQATNRFEEAELLYRRALKICEAGLGPDHPQVAEPLNNLALLLADTKRFEEAEPLYRRALKICEAGLGPDHPQVAEPLNCLAILLAETNRLEEAEPLYRQALKICEASLGPDHPDVATPLNNLALLLADTNRFEEAEPLYRRALKIWEDSLGPDHPHVAQVLNNLAGLLSDISRLEEAEPLYRRALKIMENNLGPNHPYVSIRLDNLAGVLQATNRHEQAEPVYRRALAIDEASFGPDHPNVAIRLNNLAGVLQATNRLEEAEPLYRRALSISETSFGSNHPAVARGLNNLASVLLAVRRFEEAEPMSQRALAMTKATLGPDHPEVAISLSQLGQIHLETNRLDKAERYFESALIALPEDHPNKISIDEYINQIKQKKQELYFPKVFISFSRADEKWAEAFAINFREMNCEVFYDSIPIELGASWRRKIEENIDNAEILILIISEDALSSDIVKMEWQNAYQQIEKIRKVKIVPILIGNSNTPSFVKNMQSVRLQNLEDKLVKKLVADLINRFNEAQETSKHVFNKNKEIRERYKEIGQFFISSGRGGSDVNSN